MYTMATSIAHRITGLGLTIGFVAFAAWLIALASGPEAYADFVQVAGSPLGRFVLAGFVLAFWYHFCAGIRHLIWDTGHMLEKPDARRAAVMVVVAAVVLSAVTLVAMFRAGGAT